MGWINAVRRLLAGIADIGADTAGVHDLASPREKPGPFTLTDAIPAPSGRGTFALVSALDRSSAQETEVDS